MPRRPSQPALRPRVVNDAMLAVYLGKSVSWLGEHRQKLESRGFPARLAEIGGNDLVRVDEWLDNLCAQRTPVSAEVERVLARITANVR